MKPPRQFRNGSPGPRAVAPPQPKQVHLKDIPETDWPAARTEIIANNIHREFSNIPAFDVAQPVVVPRINPDGSHAPELKFGLRRREYVALELMSAAIAARIRNPGVLGSNDPIPGDSVELAALVRRSVQAAGVFLDECHAAQQKEFDAVKFKMEERLDAMHYGDGPRPTDGKMTTRIVSED